MINFGREATRFNQVSVQGRRFNYRAWFVENRHIMMARTWLQEGTTVLDQQIISLLTRTEKSTGFRPSFGGLAIISVNECNYFAVSYSYVFSIDSPASTFWAKISIN